ncbi:hypothetical protein Aperf_G00000024750 [Anoplocephala perfoliata]
MATEVLCVFVKSTPLKILQTENSYAISAPTGSGKTVLFELAICKFLTVFENFSLGFKPFALYLAPLKSLCSERMSDWQNKLQLQGYTFLELTSDSPYYDIKDLSEHAVLIATPEKVDSLMRSLDGIHTIAEPIRGACLEAVVTRLMAYNPRIIAVTATCSNISDIARWLSTNERECLCRRGVGFHHAGMDPVDRRLVEEAFIEGHIPVLVIIKNTSLYVEGNIQEYTSQQMLQMIGRAGRPQFDMSATAVIMTTSDKKEYYEHCLEDAENVESSLHVCLTDFLNVEIVLDRIRSFDDVMHWISCTYLAVRLSQNPTFYGLQKCHLDNNSVKLELESLRNLLWATTTSSGRETLSVETMSSPHSAAMAGFACMAHAIELAKVMANRLWADAPLVAIRQLPEIGKDYANQLAGAGVTSLKDIERVGPRGIEQILRRHPPFGDRVYESALHVPKYELAAEQSTAMADNQVEFELAIRLTRSCKFDQVALIVADDKNRIIFKTLLSTSMIEALGGWSHRVVVYFDPAVHHLFMSLISFNFLGIDLNINFPISWTNSCSTSIQQEISAASTVDGSIDIPLPVTVSPHFLTSPNSVKVKRERKQTSSRAAGTKPSRAPGVLTAVMSTPKVTNTGFKQTDILKFFKATKSHLEQAPEGKVINALPSISPVSRFENPFCTPSFSIYETDIPEVHSSLATFRTPNLPSLHFSPPSKSVPEIQPPLKRIKWNKTGNAGEDEISPETDKMVEEELCSFLSIVETAEPKEHSPSTVTLQMDDTVSPIFLVDLDASHDHTEKLELSTPTSFSAGEVQGEEVAKEQLALNPSFHKDYTISPILPLDVNRSPRKAAFSTPKFPHESSVTQTHEIGFEAPKILPSIDFKTPKAMQLCTSLDDPCDSPEKKLTRPAFKVPMSEIPLRRLKRPSQALFTTVPSAATSTKLSKKVSFGRLLAKSDKTCDDTGYVSSPISKEPRVIEIPVENASEKNQLTAVDPGLEKRSGKELVEEFEPNKVLRKTPPSSEVDFGLLREGWDQLATFIYCCNILQKFDSEKVDFVALSAPRTPPSNPVGPDCLNGPHISSSVNINSATECPTSESPHRHQMKTNPGNSKGTDQVEE